MSDVILPTVINLGDSTTYRDQIVVRVSGDHYLGAPLFQLYVDGEPIGTPQTVTADFSAGEWQDFVYNGTFGGTSPDRIEVRFLNDAWGGTADTDRNLHIQSIGVNGQTFNLADGAYTDSGAYVTGQTVLERNGGLSIVVPSEPEAPAPVSTESTITVRVSGDAYKGDAKFNVYVDGKLMLEGQSVSAQHKLGQWQDVTVTGDFGVDGPSNVEIKFTNDAWGGNASKDRNLYVDYIDVNGQRFEAEDASYFRGSKEIGGREDLRWNGSLKFDTSGAAPVNLPLPNAQGDTAATEEDRSVTVNVLANDRSDVAMKLLSVGTAGHGQVAMNADGTVTYTPATNFSGTDSFSYTLIDDLGLYVVRYLGLVVMIAAFMAMRNNLNNRLAPPKAKPAAA